VSQFNGGIEYGYSKCNSIHSPSNLNCKGPPTFNNAWFFAIPIGCIISISAPCCRRVDLEVLKASPSNETMASEVWVKETDKLCVCADSRLSFQHRAPLPPGIGPVFCFIPSTVQFVNCDGWAPRKNAAKSVPVIELRFLFCPGYYKRRVPIRAYH